MQLYLKFQKILKKKLFNQKKIIIRPFKLYDAYNYGYFDWLSDKEVTKHIYRDELGEGFDKVKIIKYLKKILKSKKDIFFSVFIDKKMVGTLKISKINKKTKSGEIGIMIGDKFFWNKGLGKILILYLIEYCFEKLKMKKIYAGTSLKNIAMKKVFLKLGFNIFKISKLNFSNKLFSIYQFVLLKKENKL